MYLPLLLAYLDAASHGLASSPRLAEAYQRARLLAYRVRRQGELYSERAKAPLVVVPHRVEENITIPRMREADGARGLLLEIIRRAAHDWVLYRDHRTMEKRQLAEDAYIWLFLEGPGHRYWKERIDEGKEFTSFLHICEVLDLEVEKWRAYFRTLTVQKISAAGRQSDPDRKGSRGSSKLSG